MIAGAVVAGVVLIALWQAGGLFSSKSDAILPGKPALALRPADTSFLPPNPRGLDIGLDEGDLAPDFEFSAFDGQRRKLSDFRGQAVFLNFWATWCGPCRVELPDMEAVLRNHAGDRLAVVGVNSGESFSRAEAYIRDLGVELTALAFDPRQDIVKRYAVNGLPVSYFIDRDGVITRVSTGQLSRRVMESAVAEALAGYASRGR
jgi:peroxiredoxin